MISEPNLVQRVRETMRKARGSQDRWRSAIWGLAGLLVAVGAQAAESQTGGERGQGTIVAGVAAPAREAAPVVIDGVKLFEVRGVTAFPAERRATEISARIELFAQDKAFDPNAVEAVDLGNRTRLSAGKYELMTVFDVDAQNEGIARPLIAEVYRRRIAEAVAAYRSDRTPRALLLAAGYTLAAAALLVALIYLLGKGFRGLDGLIARRFKAKLGDVRIQSFRILQAEHLWAGVQGALRATHVIVAILVVAVFIDFALGRFPWTRALQERLLGLVVNPLLSIGRGIVEAIPNLLFLAILVIVTRYLLKTIRLFFVAVARGSVKMRGFDQEWAWPTYRIVRLLVIAFAAVVAYPYIPGSDSGAFKGISLFLGVIFSLGSTSVIANIIAGYTMTYRRAFRVGDRVKIGAHVGDVEEVRLLVTSLRSLKGERVVIPNSIILNSDLVNYSGISGTQGLILHTTVGIGYETPWRQVEAMLLMAAERTPGLLREPAAFVLQQALGDFCVTYELNVHCDQPHQMPQLYTALHRNILDVFNEYGVQIMTPAYVADAPQPKVVSKDQWHLSPAPKPTD
jgi:small-conductance mechanosensitive channel